MQAARLLDPRPRTVRSKLIEMARALQLETRYGRRGVLDIWLTLAPFGGNLEGIRAGSLAWFGVPPEALEPAQAALLVAIPRRPERLRPDRHPAAAQPRARPRAGRRLARRPVRRRRPTDACADSARPAAAPRAAARGLAAACRVVLHHAGSAVAGRTGAARAGAPGVPAATRVARHAGGRCTPRATSCACIRAPGATRIRAGALDLTQAVRSPGSALKPFIYAMAFADGIAAPDTVCPTCRAASAATRRRTSTVVSPAASPRRGAAPLAQPARRCAAGSRRPAAVRCHGARRRCHAAAAARCRSVACRWRWAATASRCARRPRCTPRWQPTALAARCACSPMTAVRRARRSFPRRGRTRWPTC